MFEHSPKFRSEMWALRSDLHVNKTEMKWKNAKRNVAFFSSTLFWAWKKQLNKLSFVTTDCILAINHVRNSFEKFVVSSFIAACSVVI